jgi:hypothetical protein
LNHLLKILSYFSVGFFIKLSSVKKAFLIFA